MNLAHQEVFNHPRNPSSAKYDLYGTEGSQEPTLEFVRHEPASGIFYHIDDEPRYDYSFFAARGQP